MNDYSMDNSGVKHIDLNCDMGEFEMLSEAELDCAIMPHISRCNIAVGGHAGNRDTIKFCFAEAAKHQLKTGIHPSYADKENFGRQVLSEPWSKTLDDLQSQIDLGLSVAQTEGIVLTHIKLHGALYNEVEANPEAAQKVAGLLANFRELSVLGMANGLLQRACNNLSLAFIKEAFIDRRYINVSQLQPRSEAGAVYSEEEDIVRQASAIASQQPVISATGQALNISADSLCIHSDTPNVMRFIKAIRQQFQSQGIHVG